MAVRSQWGNPKCLESAGARLNPWKVNSKVAEVETQETALQGEVLHSGIHASSWSAFGSVTLQIRMRIIFVLAIALSVFPMALAAQVGTATISGVVGDRWGARVSHARAELQASGSETKVYKAEADGQGQYRFLGLPAGDYTLKLASPGFRPLTVKLINLAEGQEKTMPPLRLTVSEPCCCGDPALDYVRVLPADSRGSNLEGSVRPDSWDGPPAVSARVTLICETGKVCGTTNTNSGRPFYFGVSIPESTTCCKAPRFLSTPSIAR